MKIELTDVDEYEFMSFVQDLAEVEGLSNLQVEQINNAFANHGQAGITIARHHDEEDWSVWNYPR